MTKRQSKRQARQDHYNGAEVMDFAPHFSEQRPRKALKPLEALNDRQAQYIRSINTKTMTFGLGPFGTGKTYICARIAAELFLAKKIDKIIVSRPAVEAGESIGYLPGDANEKIDPFFIPVKEVLIEVLGKGRFEYAIKAEQIQFVPVGFMRGRTLKNAFVIVDEAQNLTPMQMKMVLTRLGESSTYVVNGDLCQSDITGPNGLFDARTRLRGKNPQINFVTFLKEDIVRHDLGQFIAEAYETDEDIQDDNPELPLFVTKPVDRAA